MPRKKLTEIVGGSLPKMSSFQAEYKQRRLKIKGIFTLTVENIDNTEQDFTILEDLLSDKIADLATEYLAKESTLQIIDKERYKVMTEANTNSL